MAKARASSPETASRAGVIAVVRGLSSMSHMTAMVALKSAQFMQHDIIDCCGFDPRRVHSVI